MSIEGRTRYDFPTAVTFFLAGLGVGSLLALVFTPRSDLQSFHPEAPSAQNAGRSTAL